MITAIVWQMLKIQIQMNSNSNKFIVHKENHTVNANKFRPKKELIQFSYGLESI